MVRRFERAGLKKKKKTGGTRQAQRSDGKGGSHATPVPTVSNTRRQRRKWEEVSRLADVRAVGRFGKKGEVAQEKRKKANLAPVPLHENG